MFHINNTFFEDSSGLFLYMKSLYFTVCPVGTGHCHTYRWIFTGANPLRLIPGFNLLACLRNVKQYFNIATQAF